MLVIMSGARANAQGADSQSNTEGQNEPRENLPLILSYHFKISGSPRALDAFSSIELNTLDTSAPLAVFHSWTNHQHPGVSWLFRLSRLLSANARTFSQDEQYQFSVARKTLDSLDTACSSVHDEPCGEKFCHKEVPPTPNANTIRRRRTCVQRISQCMEGSLVPNTYAFTHDE